MEYVQERIATVHDLTGRVPDAPVDRAAVVVPMTDREYAGLAPERTLSALEDVDPARVIVPIRAPADRVESFVAWLSGFDLPLTPLWCNAPAVEALLDGAGIDAPAGKGRDVWLGLGPAAREEFVALHDADVKNYDASQVPRLLAPLEEFDFAKGYYARVENDRLYGRLFRLFYEPLVAALAVRHPEPILEYLGAFRYALAGEMGFTSTVARRLRPEPAWGLETGLLGEAFGTAGFGGTVQVDLGVHEHDHRAVSGETGLAGMSEHVAGALFRVLDERGIDPEFETLAERYREVAERFLAGYAADAAFNGLAYDRAAERSQVDAYAEAISPAEGDDRLPAWADADLDPGAVLDASGRAIDAL
ncbi:glycosyltransferase family protein [Halalkalicoccus jeotgali]|uniref:Glycosyltransferase-like protein n=1 Tax=Halalkalicoccus jeotgali (strain DSM 18796 / CECT 7217 / JCM 14584 / KCTC 4019 / B3) TaxID=795797 RepID=D8J8H7_HALJB|nr:glycosyl transferase family 2 [Halalkalicoccus jeotgali]ADJ16223.1 glycosyltransferase-like protein [Halalkalicoccus jeotgali B3]ELY37298.1 glycosyltransferase-like protein [Halalkalicoccus jeotgali B3]